MCGGTATATFLHYLAEGLSPRVRGNHGQQPILERRPRSIPACAGEPLPVVDGRAVAEVYPRVCGGTVADVLTGEVEEGLSPRVRGNLRRGAGVRPA